MEDAWQSNQDIAPTSGGISIPTHDAGLGNGSAMVTDEQGWNANGAGGGRSPGRDRDVNGDRPRRSSRSRSPGAAREGERGNNPGNNLHVSGLSHRVDTRDLEAAFAKIGRVKKASVMYDPHTRESRGFGFVTMETTEEADAAITALNGTDLMGKTLNVEKARRGRARTPTPGRYYGPPKRHDSGPVERPYDPRPYDSRYSRDFDDRRGGRGRYDDYRRDDPFGFPARLTLVPQYFIDDNQSHRELETACNGPDAIMGRHAYF
ncbi:putative related to transformer-2 protein homolog [Lyophyllum shimeji]|uniref:Related to transformer-2 protein homolog n=1 Tax=Lyophyllum shimeji TaxID=47721 RepID=A0A9P3PY59_LYOSH|nr:putative related to transformer-2 protein homolog [Lyophyllum shimeji]